MSVYKLDLTHFLCPLPLLMTKKALTQLAAGDELHLYLNQQTSFVDLQLFCQDKGYLLSLVKTPPTYQKLIIYK